MKRIICALMLVAASVFFPFNAMAQRLSSKDLKDHYSFIYVGAGLGLEYGGIGVQVEYLTSEYLGIFAGGGYNLVEGSFNVGVNAKVLPVKAFCPTITAMYGYNAALRVNDSYGNTFGKTYYGLSLGVGAEVRNNRSDREKLSFGIRSPFRSDEFHSHYNALKDQGAEFNPGILPFTVSVGYHLGLAKRPRNKTEG